VTTSKTLGAAATALFAWLNEHAQWTEADLLSKALSEAREQAEADLAEARQFATLVEETSHDSELVAFAQLFLARTDKEGTA
jgi:hypothetical protein